MRGRDGVVVSSPLWGLLLLVCLFASAAHAEDCALDLVILIDGSGSVSASEFNFYRTFLEDVAIGISTVSSTSLHVAVVQYSQGTRVELSLEDGISADAIVAAASSMQQSRGETNQRAALEVASEELLSFGRSGVRKAIVLLTDGVATSGNPVPVASSIRQSGVIILAVGIGELVDAVQLREIASDDSVYTLASFLGLESIVGVIRHTFCGTSSLNLVLPDWDEGFVLDSTIPNVTVAWQSSKPGRADIALIPVNDFTPRGTVYLATSLSNHAGRNSFHWVVNGTRFTPRAEYRLRVTDNVQGTFSESNIFSIDLQVYDDGSFTLPVSGLAAFANSVAAVAVTSSVCAAASTPFLPTNVAAGPDPLSLGTMLGGLRYTVQVGSMGGEIDNQAREFSDDLSWVNFGVGNVQPALQSSGQRGESQNTQAFLELLGRDPPPVLKSRRPVKNAVSFASWLGARTLFWYYRDEIHAHLEASGVAWHGERVFSSLRELQSVLEEDGAEGGGLVNEFGSVSEDGPLALLTGNIIIVVIVLATAFVGTLIFSLLESHFARKKRRRLEALEQSLRAYEQSLERQEMAQHDGAEFLEPDRELQPVPRSSRSLLLNFHHESALSMNSTGQTGTELQDMTGVSTPVMGRSFASPSHSDDDAEEGDAFFSESRFEGAHDRNSSFTSTMMTAEGDTSEVSLRLPEDIGILEDSELIRLHKQLNRVESWSTCWSVLLLIIMSAYSSICTSALVSAVNNEGAPSSKISSGGLLTLSIVIIILIGIGFPALTFYMGVIKRRSTCREGTKANSRFGVLFAPYVPSRTFFLTVLQARDVAIIIFLVSLSSAAVWQLALMIVIHLTFMFLVMWYRPWKSTLEEFNHLLNASFAIIQTVILLMMVIEGNRGVQDSRLTLTLFVCSLGLIVTNALPRLYFAVKALGRAILWLSAKCRRKKVPAPLTRSVAPFRDDSSRRLLSAGSSSFRDPEVGELDTLSSASASEEFSTRPSSRHTSAFHESPTARNTRPGAPVPLSVFPSPSMAPLDTALVLPGRVSDRLSVLASAPTPQPAGPLPPIPDKGMSSSAAREESGESRPQPPGEPSVALRTLVQRMRTSVGSPSSPQARDMAGSPALSPSASPSDLTVSTTSLLLSPPAMTPPAGPSITLRTNRFKLAPLTTEVMRHSPPPSPVMSRGYFYSGGSSLDGPSVRSSPTASGSEHED